MTHLLYLTAILLVGLYCEGRGFRRGVKCEASRNPDTYSWESDGTLYFASKKGIRKIVVSDEIPSPSTL